MNQDSNKEWDGLRQKIVEAIPPFVEVEINSGSHPQQLQVVLKNSRFANKEQLRLLIEGLFAKLPYTALIDYQD